MSKRIPQKINSIEKKERLAETCYYLACQTPYESITISEICDRAKVSIGTFYSYFDSKSDIIKYSIMIIINKNLTQSLREISYLSCK